MSNQINKALIVGIDDYKWAPLKGCVADAKAMEAVLSRNDDKSINFHCKTLTSDKIAITENQLRKEIIQFFDGEADLGLFYFSGHGGTDGHQGYLNTTDAKLYSQGFPFEELMRRATGGHKIKEIFIVLDCCYSGEAADANWDTTLQRKLDLPRLGINILTASQPKEYAREKKGRGMFTQILENGLRGHAADIRGRVTAASLFYYVDQMFGPFEQRPMFKMHVSRFKVLRQCEPQLTHEDIRKLKDFFPTLDHHYPLDEQYAPDFTPRNYGLLEQFDVLQKYLQLGLIEPSGAKSLYDAARNRQFCRLTPQGRAYWSILKKGLI